MGRIILILAVTLAGPESSLAGEFPMPRAPAYIAGTWEATSLDRYCRLVILENGEGSLIVAGVGNSIEEYAISSLEFGDSLFEFYITFRHSTGARETLSYGGTLWFGTGLLLFDRTALKPMSQPPVFSFLRQETLKTLSDNVTRRIGK